MDSHWLFYWWNVYGRPFLFGQVNSDKKWIAEHMTEYHADQQLVAND